MEGLEIRAVEDPASADQEALLLALWAEVFGPRWPLDAGFLRSTLALARSQPGGVLLARRGAAPVGFAFAQIAPGSSIGSLLALGVLPGLRRQGIGRALHAASVDFLRGRGARMVGVGCGGLRYFWPGVPLGGDGGAWPFFAALGCAEIWRAADLAQPLEHYATPAWVWERVSGQGLSIGPALPAEREAALAMVAAELPDWLEFYAGAFDGDRAEEVILARDAGGAVLGACLLDCPTTRWAGCFDGPAAAPGCVLTAASARGRGIGLAVTARASEIARQRGCSVGFIGFTHLAAWYQKLGYKLWEEYAMSGWEYS